MGAWKTTVYHMQTYVRVCSVYIPQTLLSPPIHWRKSSFFTMGHYGNP